MNHTNFITKLAESGVPEPKTVDVTGDKAYLYWGVGDGVLLVVDDSGVATLMGRLDAETCAKLLAGGLK